MLQSGLLTGYMSYEISEFILNKYFSDVDLQTATLIASFQGGFISVLSWGASVLGATYGATLKNESKRKDAFLGALAGSMIGVGLAMLSLSFLRESEGYIAIPIISTLYFIPTALGASMAAK